VDGVILNFKMIEFRLLNSIKDFQETADDIGFYVQSIGGNFTVHRHHVSFHVPIKYTEFMLLKYSNLTMEAYVW
jgi:hypothetical protein